VGETEQRRLVGPVDVVEDDDESAPVGHVPHGLHQVFEHLEAVLG